MLLKLWTVNGGKVVRAFGKFGVRGPAGVAVLPDRNIAVVEYESHKIQVVAISH